eukprot:jgi/Astpho2/3584/Aster-06881
MAKSVPVAAEAHDGRPSSSEYLEEHCAAYAEDHHAVVDHWLRPFRAGIDAAHIVEFPHPEWWSPTPEGDARLPLVFNINGELSLHSSIRSSPSGLIVPKNNFTGLGNLGFFHLPVIRAATEVARCGDFVLAHSPYAMPIVGHLQAPFPYAGVVAKTEWRTQLAPQDWKKFRKDRMSLQDQVDEFKMLIYVDGHCGALRQKDLLSSDSTVLMVQSSHELWHYPIMFP